MLSDLLRTLRAEDIAVSEGVSLRRKTHVRIGGTATVFIEPANEQEVAIAVRMCREKGIKLHLLGGGSNLLVADEELEGAVLSLGRFDRISRGGYRVTAGAGVTLPSLLKKTREAGLAGLEILTGIPAQVGGAVAMNAGTRDGETFDRLVSLIVINPDGELQILGPNEFRPGYRDGGLSGSVVLHATFELEPEDPKIIQSRFEQSLRYRNDTQPVSGLTLGCVFRNPESAPAALLIDQAGCKGMRVGGIAVSAKHANYFVNEGEGTCEDFLKMMEVVRERVREHSGAELVAEVKIWGVNSEGCVEAAV
ncbi:MAG: UDP-N-acetylmuramate dehydrogenase [Planctomycetota bacterium]|nr:UDP-N-acetylmuramate dehydrogenase [Planctomycetota bacterium]